MRILVQTLSILIGIFLAIIPISDALSSSSSSLLNNVSLHKVYLRKNPPFTNNDESCKTKLASSAWCYAATVDPTSSSSSSSSSLYNFLATQVWPSAREASFFLEQYMDPSWTTACEFGCGPGLPSLVLASQHRQTLRVIATDLDLLALEMVQKAAEKQGLSNLETKCVDLTAEDQYFEELLDEVHADLYILSDVFENGEVAQGAARLTIRALKKGSRVWCFAQSDRAQREIYLKELEQLLGGVTNEYGTVDWQVFSLNDIKLDKVPSSIKNDKLLLVGLDELNVMYG